MALKSMSISALRRELAKRETSLKSAQARGARVAKRLATLDAEIAALGGRRGPGRPAATAGRKASRRRGRKPGPRKGVRRRAKNKMTLPDVIAAATKAGTVVSPAQAAKLAKARGYKTTSKTFGVQVASALTKDKRFTKKGRGRYQRVAGAAARPAKTTRRRKKTAAKRK